MCVCESVVCVSGGVSLGTIVVKSPAVPGTISVAVCVRVRTAGLLYVPTTCHTINYHPPTATYRVLYEISYLPFVYFMRKSTIFSFGSLAFVIAGRMDCNFHKLFPCFSAVIEMDQINTRVWKMVRIKNGIGNDSLQCNRYSPFQWGRS